MQFTGLSDFLWYALLLAVFVIANMLAQRRNRRASEERLRREAQHRQMPQDTTDPDTSWGHFEEPATPVPAPPAPEVEWGRSPRTVQAATVPPEHAWGRGAPGWEPAPTPPRRSLAESRDAGERRSAAATVGRRRRAPLFRSREDLRRGVVLMTVLGPCRSAEPYSAGASDQFQGGAQVPPAPAAGRGAAPPGR
jgi:hypothetical protein